MSDKIFQNREMIHIVSEVIVLTGMTYYFSSQNKKLSARIDELSKKIEQQEQQMLTMDSGLRQIAGALAMTNQRLDSVQPGSTGLPPVVPNPTQSNPVVPLPTQPISVQPGVSQSTTKITFKNPISSTKIIEEIPEDDDISDSDLDEEIRAEIQELTDQEDSSLKKQN
jgi:hypothetical protein